jgi:hypothetical protein
MNANTAQRGKAMTQETFLEMARRHRDDDMLVVERFEMVDGQACSIGCFCHDYGLEPSDFSGLAEITGYPEAAHHLQEAIFEGLPEAERANWHVAFAEKAETVTGWQAVIDKTVLASLRIAEPHDTSESKIVAAVIALYERRLSGDNPSDAEWAAAEADARAAAGAAWAAAWDAWDDAAAARAARDAAAAAAAAARDSGRDARAAAWAAARAAWSPEEAAAAAARDSGQAAAWDARAAARAAARVQIRDAFLNA